MRAHSIFSSQYSDLTKIFLATLIAFILIQFSGVLNSSIFILLTIYFLDGGHVYSTFIEVLFDPSEARKKYVSAVLLGTFLLNFIIHYFSGSYFFFYIFYFTIFHNMRQGLGITFLYRAGTKTHNSLIKFFYYFLTLAPFLIFHLRGPMNKGLLSDEILMPFYLHNYLSPLQHSFVTNVLPLVYLGIACCFFIYLFLTKNTKGIFTMAFFASVYAYGFIFSTNELKSYVLLIFSHAIPYYFLMEKRINLTHTSKMIKKYAGFFLVAVFAFGGFVDYFQEDLVEMSGHFDSLAIALLTTPLISHFIFDAIIWKRGNDRFKSFLQATS